MKNSGSHTHVQYLRRMIHINYTQCDSVTPDSLMISLFIISGRCVTPKFSHQLGCCHAGVDTTNIWPQQPFSSLHSDQTDKRSACVLSACSVTALT